ncbi:hypothetical protein ACGFZL_02725 [Streptomyces sp. NPDC048182]|uniref:hypothetical protein n=1 Tax=Streptomyces sp. NPDC048182 TaxID=3365507 RepID=UPI0037206F34
MGEKLIDPSGIPHFIGDLATLDTDAANLTTHAGEFRTAGSDVHTEFQGLSACYEAPEAEQLFATTLPVQTKSDAFAGDLEKVSTALSDYSTEVQPLVTRLETLKADATAFVDSVAGDDDWRTDQDKVDHNNDLWHDVNHTVAAFQSAERTAYNKIMALIGGTALTTDDGSHGTNMYGFKADDLDHAEETPWGSSAEREYEGLAWLGHQIKSYVWDGFIVDGVWGTVKGLGTLVGTDGWDAAGQAWKHLAQLGTGLAISAIPVVGDVYWQMPEDKLPSWLRESRTTMKETGKALVAWDTWKTNPSRAAGQVTFNAVTAIFTGGTGSAASGAGKAGAVARTLSVAGKVGRIVDPMTYVGKAGKLAYLKIGDTFTTLKNLRTGATLDLLRQADATRSPAIPDTAIPYLDNATGKVVYLTDEGHLLNPDGTLHQHADQAPGEVSAADRARIDAAQNPGHAPQLVGGAGHTPRGVATHLPGDTPGGLTHEPPAGHEAPAQGHATGQEGGLPGADAAGHDAATAAGHPTDHPGAGSTGEDGGMPPTGSHELPPSGSYPERPRGNLPDGSWTGEGGLHLSPEANHAAEGFLRESAAAEPRITDTLQQITHRVDDGRLIGLEYRLKGEESLKRKLATELLDDFDLRAEDALTGVKDSVRYTVEIPSSGYTRGVQQAVDTLQARGFENVTFKNTWESNGYKGINSTWRDPASGRIFEVQFHTPESFTAKMDGHILYEKERLPGVSAENLKTIRAEQHDLFGKFPVPHGASEVHLSPHAHAPDLLDDAADHAGPPNSGAGPHAGGAQWVTEPSEYAGRMYEQIRATPNRVDLPEVSRNTGIGEPVLREVKSHLFRAQHDVPLGPGKVGRGLFEPRDDVADLWVGARNGTLSEAELREFSHLMAHEYMESQFMKAGLPYAHAHDHLYSPTIDNGVPTGYQRDFPRDLRDAGAHELAPNATRGGFLHWSRGWGLTPPSVPLADNLSNIHDVVKAAFQELRAKGIELK